MERNRGLELDVNHVAYFLKREPELNTPLSRETGGNEGKDKE